MSNNKIRIQEEVFLRKQLAVLNLFLGYVNSLNDTGKIKLTMQVADENGLEFSDFEKQPPEVFYKKKYYYKFHKIHRKTPVPESLF